MKKSGKWDRSKTGYGTIKERKQVRQSKLRGKVVKQNINFLDKACWLPSSKRKEESTSIETSGTIKMIEYSDNSGFKLRASDEHGFPEHLDRKWLYYFMLKLQEKYHSITPSEPTISFKSYHNLFRELGIPVNDVKYYKRIKLFLDRWYYASLEFEGNSFYIPGTKEKIEGSTKFHIITDYTFHYQSGIAITARNMEQHEGLKGRLLELKISFCGTWLRANQALFSRELPLVPILELNSLGLRLYEILCKSFWGGTDFYIMRDRLAVKMGKTFQSNWDQDTQMSEEVLNINRITNFPVELIIEENKYHFMSLRVKKVKE